MGGITQGSKGEKEKRLTHICVSCVAVFESWRKACPRCGHPVDRPLLKARGLNKSWRNAEDRSSMDRRARELGLLAVLQVMDPGGRLDGGNYLVRRPKRNCYNRDYRTIAVDLVAGTWVDPVSGAAGEGFTSLVDVMYQDCPNHEVFSAICNEILAAVEDNPDFACRLNSLAKRNIESATKAGKMIVGDQRRRAVEFRARALLRDIKDIDLAIECTHDFNLARCRPPLEGAALTAVIEAAAAAELSRDARR
ncbi:MAG: hypothetical protein AB7P12_07960 [Alphaproteobacteria bacterium]